jgi:glutathione S-transferase
MTYTLYSAPGTASMCVHWMLIELGVPFEFVALDFEKKAQKDPAYLRINPSGQVPALIVDGKAHAEAAALLMILAERHPERGFAPAIGTPERADYLQWMVYLANTLMPAFRLFYYADEGAGPENVAATKAQAEIRIAKAWDRIDALLSDGRPYMLGAQMRAADFLLTMLTRWSRNNTRTAMDWPHLKSYVERLRATPSYRETHEREGLQGWI